MTYWNYCDYRCEECKRSFECPVAIKEREQVWKAIAEGREFDPIDAVKENMDEALAMVRKMAKERGIDLDSLKAHEIEEPDFLLVEKAKKFAINVMNFSKNMENRLLSEEKQKAVHDLCWYSSLLGAKLYRCLAGRFEALKEDDSELKEIDMDDAFKTAKVVAKAISKCRNALDSLLQEDLSEIQKFHDELKAIEKGFKIEFQTITQDKRLLN